MRKLAVDSHSGAQASPSPGAAALPTSSGTSGLSASAKDSDKVPRTLPPGVWTEQIKKFEAVQIHGRHRVFPQQRLLGAECSLAKLWHQLKVTRDFSPLPLGEIMSRRSFDATGAVNALSKRKLSKELIVDVDRDRLVAEDAEDSWEPRSMLAVIDALEALRWAYILLEFGHEFDVCTLFDDFIHKARQRPQQLDSFRSYYESASWKLCRELRVGRTFAEAVSAVREDLHLFQEVMSRPPPTQGKASGGKGDPNKKRKQYDESPRRMRINVSARLGRLRSNLGLGRRSRIGPNGQSGGRNPRDSTRGTPECPASPGPQTWHESDSAAFWSRPGSWHEEWPRGLDDPCAQPRDPRQPPPPPPPQAQGFQGLRHHPVRCRRR